MLAPGARAAFALPRGDDLEAVIGALLLKERPDGRLLLDHQNRLSRHEPKADPGRAPA